MLGLKEINSNGVVVLEASGKITREDCHKVFPKLEAGFDDHESLHFYIDLRDLSGMELVALKEDLRFDVKHKWTYPK
jgi:stage II sporulation SpoAA-like protein